MVNYCRVIGCHNRSDRETQLQFYRLPKVIKNQGIECEKLSEERRRLWIASLQQNFSGKNLENIRICSAHFVSGRFNFHKIPYIIIAVLSRTGDTPPFSGQIALHN